MESLAARAREEAQAASALSWKLDTALSLLRKARAGYRASPLLGDAPWNEAPLIAAVADAACDVAQSIGSECDAQTWRHIVEAYGGDPANYATPKRFTRDVDPVALHDWGAV